MPLFNGNIGVGGKVGPFNIGTNIPISIDPFESKNAEKRPDGVGFDTSINENVASKPKNDINRMLSQVKQSGFFARPCIYYIEIIPSKSMIGKSDVQSIGLNCHTATIPGVSVATKAIDAGYTFREYPYEKIMEPVALSFKVKSVAEVVISCSHARPQVNEGVESYLFNIRLDCTTLTKNPSI